MLGGGRFAPAGGELADGRVPDDLGT